MSSFTGICGLGLSGLHRLVDSSLETLLVEAYREFNRAYVASTEPRRAEARRVTCRPTLFLRINSLSYILSKSPLAILNTGEGLYL